MINLYKTEEESNIEMENRKVRCAEALERLHENPDFQYLILQEYLTDYPVRLTSLLAVQSGESVQLVMREQMAISVFREFLKNSKKTVSFDEIEEEQENGEGVE